MSINNIKTKTQSERGFTIVELLIVIVVIGILAAITFVAYNGVTQRANTTSAKSAAVSVLKKAEAYNAETAAYPTTPGALTTGASGKSYEVTGITFATGTAAKTVKPDSPNTINFYTCASALGVQVSYYDYTTTGWTTQTTGTCTTPTFVGA